MNDFGNITIDFEQHVVEIDIMINKRVTKPIIVFYPCIFEKKWTIFDAGIPIKTARNVSSSNTIFIK